MTILIERVPARPARVARAEPRWTGGTVTVNGRTIATAEIAREVQNHAAPAEDPGRAWSAAAHALAVRTLLAEEATRRGIVATPRALGRDRRESLEEATLRALLEAEVAPQRPTADEVRAAWEAAGDRLRSPDVVEISQIVFAATPGDRAARTRARERAAAAIGAILHDPARFATIAASGSDCPSRAAAGRLGQFVETDLPPAFRAALAGLSEGEITHEPVATEHGIHVVRLDARAVGRPLPFEAVAGRIADRLERAAWVASARAFVVRLVSAASIEGLDLAPELCHSLGGAADA